TTEVDDDSLRALVVQAEELARHSPVDVEYVPSVGPQKYKPVSGFTSKALRTAVADRSRAINDVIGRFEKAELIGAGLHKTIAIATGFATKNGAFGYDPSSLASLSVTARSRDGTRSGYALRSHVDPADLDVRAVAQRAIDKAITSENAKTIPPGVYPVILEPQAVSDM